MNRLLVTPHSSCSSAPSHLRQVQSLGSLLVHSLVQDPSHIARDQTSKSRGLYTRIPIQFQQLLQAHPALKAWVVETPAVYVSSRQAFSPSLTNGAPSGQLRCILAAPSLKVMKTNRSFNKMPISTSESGHTSLFSPNFAVRLLRSLLATPGVLLEQMGVGNSSQNRKLWAIRTTRVQHVLASYVSFRNGCNIEHMVLLSSELTMLGHP